MQGHRARANGFSNDLPFKYLFANSHYGFGGRTTVLAHGQNQLSRQRQLPNRLLGRLCFVFCWMNAAMKTMQSMAHDFSPEAAGRSVAINSVLGVGGCQNQVLIVVSTGTISIQSTGQGSTHKSQPVHSSIITVCICLAAPTMASTGHA